MQSEAHLTAAMLAVVDALRGGIDEAQRQLDRTQRIQRATTDMPGLTLRQRGLTDVCSSAESHRQRSTRARRMHGRAQA